MQANHRAALGTIGGLDPERARLLGETWLQHMRRGHFEAAWKVSDEVLRWRAGRDCAHLPRYLQWVWKGQPLRGKRVLIRCYHGLGDTIQFIRFAPLVKEVAAKVTVSAQPELLPLLRTAHGVDELLPLHDGSPKCEFEADVELMELQHIFRTKLATIPRDVPYLHLQPAELANSGKFNVGLVWAAGEWDERRSVPFDLVQKLAKLPGVTWHILQRGPALEDWRRKFGINSGNDDVLHAARTIAALDLLISVDTLAAHLGGALGVPTWTLLHAEPDWRWMRDRTDSPWYPTMRLFRQPAAGDWENAIASLLKALREKLRKLPRSARPRFRAARV